MYYFIKKPNLKHMARESTTHIWFAAKKSQERTAVFAKLWRNWDGDKESSVVGEKLNGDAEGPVRNKFILAGLSMCLSAPIL